jgi:predicted nucleotidyltransferase
MDKSEAIKLAQKYKQLVSQYFDVEDTILYGSYSKGTQTENSDIDIAVVVDEIEGNYFDYTPLLWKLRRQVSNLIEPILICRKEDKSGFLDEIKQYGISI